MNLGLLSSKKKLRPQMHSGHEFHLSCLLNELMEIIWAIYELKEKKNQSPIPTNFEFFFELILHHFFTQKFSKYTQKLIKIC
jgi:hypothetical protein